MLLSYNADLLPRVRMLGRINYTEPWIHFSRTIDEYVLYVIRDGNMYLQEAFSITSRRGISSCLSRGCATRAISVRPAIITMPISPTRKWRGWRTRTRPCRCLRKSAG